MATLTLRNPLRSVDPFNQTASRNKRPRKRGKAYQAADQLIDDWRFSGRYSIEALLFNIVEVAASCPVHIQMRLSAKAMYYAGMKDEAEEALKPVFGAIDEMGESTKIQIAGLRLAITEFEPEVVDELRQRFPALCPEIQLKAENYVRTKNEVPETRRTGKPVRTRTHSY